MRLFPITSSTPKTVNMTDQIWKEFNEELLGFIKSRVNVDEVSKDILQEVFIKIHKGVNSIKNQDRITSWVYQITRNTIIDYYRKKKLETSDLDLESSLPDEVKEVSKDFSNCIRPFILQLPKPDRDILVATTYQNVSQKEYAANHNMAYSTVKSRLQRARVKLKNSFVDCCGLEADKYGNIISSSDNCHC